MKTDYLTRRLLHLNRLLVEAELRLERVLLLKTSFDGRPSESEYAGTVRSLQGHLAELQEQQTEILRSPQAQAPTAE